MPFTREQTNLQTAAFSDLFDYAGLFPPAGLGMSETVANFLQYLSTPHAGMLNTLVIPISRLEELGNLLSDRNHSSKPLPLSVLSTDWSTDVRLLDTFKSQHPDFATIESVETKELSAASAIQEFVERVYIELPIDSSLLQTLSSPIFGTGKASAKIRTGGLTSDAFPTSEKVAEFLRACFDRGISFKATAGLHHPLAATRPATSASEAPQVFMHGFINMMMATAATLSGRSVSQSARLLSLTDAEAKREFESVDFWPSLLSARGLFHSIGSCSFTEPTEDLQGLGWL